MKIYVDEERTPECVLTISVECQDAIQLRHLLLEQNPDSCQVTPGAFPVQKEVPGQRRGPGGGSAGRQVEEGSVILMLRHGPISSSPPCSRAGESLFLWQRVPGSPPPPPCSSRKMKGGAWGHTASAKPASTLRASGKRETWRVKRDDKGNGVGKVQPPLCTSLLGMWPPHTSRAVRVASPIAEGAWQGELAAGEQRAPMQGTAPSCC